MGFFGVDLFFVISGAIMAETTRHLKNNVHTSITFIKNRFMRIYIGWWPFFFVYLAALFLVNGNTKEKDLIASFFLLPQGLNNQLLPIVWTLCFELYFYLALGIFLAFKRKYIHIFLAVTAIGLIVFTAYNWLTELYTPRRFGDTSRLHDFYASPLILEFIAGFFVCELIRAYPKTKWMPIAFLGLLLGSTGVWYQLSGNLVSSGMAGFHHLPERVILLGGTATCLVACALLWKPPTNAISNLFAELGDASYAIYLSHIAVIYAVCLVLMRLELISSTPTIALIAISIAAICVYSWLHYRWIERPLYRFSRSVI